MRVLISGGGIAGNALAFCLSRLGHHVTVTERFPSLRATGLQIDLRGHGIDVLKRMGLEQAFRAKSVPEQGMQVVDGSGRRWAYFPANNTGQGTQSFTSEYEIMRGDFCQLLYDATEQHTEYLFGTYIESYRDEGDMIEVHFSDGSTDYFDLLVGADGQSSRTRRMMLGKNASNAVFSIQNMLLAYFTAPRPIQPKEKYIATMYMTSGGRGVMTRRHNSNNIQVYLGGKIGTETFAALTAGDVEKEKATFAEMFKNAGWIVPDIVKSLDDVDDFYLVGAYVLAGEIDAHCVWDENVAIGHKKECLTNALKAYEQKFRPFMDQVQKGAGEDDGKWDWVTSTSIGVFLQNCLMGVASLFKINIADYMMKEMVKNWSLPDYHKLRWRAPS
ncbi:fad binding domain protein [Penicillium macrosclerotiorum]|uniref:fad binding domain protein n=1 Tax=Penicillium macrosclerotiorum TaxID=303699 RepID=UPI00254668BD|nr:fad binding domain protein [Penicillium macrosclerotiorum]KAJ5698782.1 fad binding domain protein [Penicillium macrosclerotiorum]